MTRALALVALAGCGGAPAAAQVAEPPPPDTCTAVIDTEPASGAVYPSWLEAWTALNREYEYGTVPPHDDTEARVALCVHGCGGDGPWIIASGRADEPVFGLALQTPEGILVFGDLARGNVACTDPPVVSLASKPPVHVHAESPCTPAPTTYADYVFDLDVRLRTLAVTRRGFGVDPITFSLADGAATLDGAGCHLRVPLSGRSSPSGSSARR